MSLELIALVRYLSALVEFTVSTALLLSYSLKASCWVNLFRVFSSGMRKSASSLAVSSPLHGFRDFLNK